MEATILTGTIYNKLVEDLVKSKREKQKPTVAAVKKQKGKTGLKKKAAVRVTKYEVKQGTATLTANSSEPISAGADTACSCVVCPETYDESWIQCKVCKRWAHEACADLPDVVYCFCDN